jgi:hypothetical protein
MLKILVLLCFSSILLGCSGETDTEKPETGNTDSGGRVVEPGVPYSTINPQGARESADSVRKDLNKAASDLQKNLDKAKNTRGD